MGEAFAALGLGALKPLLTALALPPVPFLALIAAAAWPAASSPARRRWLVALGVAGVWLSACSGSGRWLTEVVLRPPAALDEARIAELAALARAGGRGASTIVVLGGGREAFAAEYGQPSLRPPTLARLRYGLWLSRRTGAAVAFSGGTGWAQPDGVPEADIAARVAASEFGRPLAWTESASRDTRGNAAGSVARLADGGAAQVVVIVTHAWHMPRALRLFEAAGRSASMRFVAAPIGFGHGDAATFDWLPTADGFELVRNAMREALARMLGD